MRKPYKIAHYESLPTGFRVLLDGKPANTPMGKPLLLQSEALAKAVAQEWQSQGETIRKETMPLTQAVCVAIDFAFERREALIADIIPYADTDLVCYRAGHIPELGLWQAEQLDPILAWVKERFGVTLHVTEDVMPVKQPAANGASLAAVLSGYDDWRLAVFAGAVKSLGSFMLALALVEGRIDAGTTFTLSHMEEIYETQKWGRDEEKEIKMASAKEEIAAVEKFLNLL